MARQILGTRWPKYPFSRCRSALAPPDVPEQRGGEAAGQAVVAGLVHLGRGRAIWITEGASEALEPSWALAAKPAPAARGRLRSTHALREGAGSIHHFSGKGGVLPHQLRPCMSETDSYPHNPRPSMIISARPGRRPCAAEPGRWGRGRRAGRTDDRRPGSPWLAGSGPMGATPGRYIAAACNSSCAIEHIAVAQCSASSHLVMDTSGPRSR